MRMRQYPLPGPEAWLTRPIDSWAMRNLREELCWTFTWPMGWLQGVAFNGALAAFYLLFWPLASKGPGDVVLLFTTYFATFIMADVTTTNIFGHDIEHTVSALTNDRSLRDLLLMKNTIQVLLIIVPFTLITAGLSVYHRGWTDLVLAIPGILYPMLLWLGIGNLISVMYPAIPAPMRWRATHIKAGQWRMHAPMLISYAIPYVLYFITTYIDLPGTLNQGFSAVFGLPRPEEAGAMLLGASLCIYVALTTTGLWWAHHKGMTLPMQTNLVHEAPLESGTKSAATYLLTTPKWASGDYRVFFLVGVLLSILTGIALDALIR